MVFYSASLVPGRFNQLNRELPRTLLLTPTPPGQGSTGENFLAEVCKQFPRGKLNVFAAWSRSYAVWVASEELASVPVECVDLPNEILVGRRRGPLLDKIHSFARRHQHWAALETIADQAVEYGARFQPEVVLAVLASPSIIRIARQVAERLNARLVTLVWDPPESTMKILGFDGYSRRTVMRDFRRILSAPTKCATASEAMLDHYRQEYGTDGVVLTRPIPAELRQTLSETCKDSFVIAFAGSIYARDEFEALLQALSRMNWRVNGRPIALRIFGNHFNLPVITAGQKARVEILGHHALDELLPLLAQCDLAYLPYWFDPAFSDSVRYCFPDKLVTYATAGIPVLYHGPRDASPSRFIDRYPVGISCNSFDLEELSGLIQRVARDSTLRSTAYKAAQRAYEEELNHQIFRERLLSLLA